MTVNPFSPFDVYRDVVNCRSGYNLALIGLSFGTLTLKDVQRAASHLELANDWYAFLMAKQGAAK